MIEKEIDSGTFRSVRMNKKPLSDRERAALRNLREVFPDHEIYPNMRLADVIHADWKFFNFIKGYHLDFTICDHNGCTIAAIELDDYTHDNKKAKARDAKKDGYLREANIKLVRIRELNEIQHIPLMLKEGFSQSSPKQESLHQILSMREMLYEPTVPYQVNKRAGSKSQTRHYLTAITVSIIFIGLSMWVLNAVTTRAFNALANKATAQPQQMQQDIQRRAIEQAAVQRSKAAEDSRINVQQPKYERSWVKGKSAKECAGPSGVLDNAVVRCMSDHQEMVLVKETKGTGVQWH